MIKVTISKQGAPSQMQKALPAIVKKAMIAAAKAWRDNVLPRHFDAGAARRYDYQGRTDGYNRRKRKMGSPPAMVFTGRAMRKMLTTKREPTGTAKKITLRIPTYGFFNMNYKSWPKGHTMAKEATAMTQQDLEAIYQDVQGRVTRALNAMQTGGARLKDLRR
jgi:hypothetical protein